MAFRVVIVSDLVVVRAGLRWLLASSSEFELVGESVHSGAVLDLIQLQQPELVVVELARAVYLTEELVRRCRRQAPYPRVLLVQGCLGQLDSHTLRASGAHGYFAKNEDPARFLEACRAICEGKTWEVAGTVAKDPYPGELNRLTRREKLVMFELVTGRTNVQISQRLMLSVHTVRNCVSRIFRKLELNNRAQLIGKYTLTFAQGAGSG